MSEYLHPSHFAIRGELERRFSDDAWAELSEREVTAMIEIIQGRCRKVVDEAITEFITMSSPSTGKATREKGD